MGPAPRRRIVGNLTMARRSRKQPQVRRRSKSPVVLPWFEREHEWSAELLEVFASIRRTHRALTPLNPLFVDSENARLARETAAGKLELDMGRLRELVNKQRLLRPVIRRLLGSAPPVPMSRIESEILSLSERLCMLHKEHGAGAGNLVLAAGSEPDSRKYHAFKNYWTDLESALSTMNIGALRRRLRGAHGFRLHGRMRQIYEMLDGKAEKAKTIASRLGTSESVLLRRPGPGKTAGALWRLHDEGIVLPDRRHGGYLRPDAPPPGAVPKSAKRTD